MRSITLIVVMNRWPVTLSAALEELSPYVARAVAIIDRSAGLENLNCEQAAHFDRVRYMTRAALDELRNVSLDLARDVDASAWGLILDSDEFIEAKSVVALNSLVSDFDRVSAYLLPRYNYVGHGRWATSYGFRFIRLSDPIEFSHSIHESISPSLVRNNLVWAYADAAIQHLDFLSPVPGKRRRYKALLEATIRRGDDLAFLKTLYAIECIWGGESELGLVHLDEAIAAASEPAHSGRFSGRDDFPVSIKAHFFARAGRLAEAAALWTELYASAEPRVKAECALGLAVISTQQRDHARSLEWTNASLSLWTTADGYFSRATTLCALKQRDPAYRDLMKGIELNPMAGDWRVQGRMAAKGTFGLQCLLNPDYRGLSNLVRALAQI
jgi:tetratricopeptide (TPR) repeat protein